MENLCKKMEKTSAKSKSGFTLVELVVVIAILSILAIIAIPAVINIVGNAATSGKQTDAQTLKNACSVFYTGVASGQINSTNFTPDAASTLTLHNAKASAKIYEADAKKATVADVLKYSGLSDNILKDLRYADMATSNYALGEIIYMPNNLTHTIQITKSTNLSLLQAA